MINLQGHKVVANGAILLAITSLPTGGL